MDKPLKGSYERTVYDEEMKKKYKDYLNNKAKRLADEEYLKTSPVQKALNPDNSSNTQQASASPVSKAALAGWRTGWKGYGLGTAIQTGVDIGTGYALDQTNLGSTSKNLISTGANVGSSLLANKLITGKMMLPGKFGKIVQFGIPIGLSIYEMFKSDDPDVRKKAEQEAVDALAAANDGADKQKIADELNKLNSATNQAKNEYKSILQIGDLIDPTGQVDLNRVQSIINEAKRAKEKYDLMDTMGAIYVMAGVQGGLDMIEKGKLLSAETASKIAKLNADKESAAKGNKDAMGSLKKGLDDLDAIMGHNNSVISAFSAKHQADYQNRSLEAQKMEALMRISSGSKTTKTDDPTKNAGALGARIGGMQTEYYKMLKDNDHKETPQARELKGRIDALQSVFDKMYGAENKGSGRSLSIK